MDMPKRVRVRCQIAFGMVSAQACEEAQGQPGCHGCNAATRKCEVCRKNRSRVARFGLCDACLREAVRNDLCERCRRQPRVDGLHCQNCRSKRTTTPQHEESPTPQDPAPVVIPQQIVETEPDVAASEPEVATAPPTASSNPPLAQSAVALENPHPTAEETVNVYEYYKRLPHYQRWLSKANDMNAKRVLGANQPGIKDRPRATCPDVHPTITRDQWVNLLLNICAEHVRWHGAVVGLVPYYAEAVPLPADILAHYVQDARIVLLTSKRGRKKVESKHLLVFDSPAEALMGAVLYSTGNLFAL